MNILAELAGRLDRLSCFAELGVEPAELPGAVLGLSDRSVVEVARELAAIANDVSRLQALVAGVAAHRSQRRDGQTGLAAGQGHASPASLIQDITGGSKGDALRQVRVGTALLEDAIELREGRAGGGLEPEPNGGDGDGSGADAGGSAGSATTPSPTYKTVLRDAHLDRRLTDQQHDVIRCGLGEPADDSDEAA